MDSINAPQPTGQPAGQPTGAQLRAARAMLDVSRNDLASMAGIGSATLVRLESGEERSPHPKTIDAVVDFFRSRGVTFTAGVDDDGLDTIGITGKPSLMSNVDQKSSLLRNVAESALKTAASGAFAAVFVIIAFTGSVFAMSRIFHHMDQARLAEYEMVNEKQDALAQAVMSRDYLDQKKLSQSMLSLDLEAASNGVAPSGMASKNPVDPKFCEAFQAQYTKVVQHLYDKDTVIQERANLAAREIINLAGEVRCDTRLMRANAFSALSAERLLGLE